MKGNTDLFFLNANFVHWENVKCCSIITVTYSLSLESIYFKVISVKLWLGSHWNGSQYYLQVVTHRSHVHVLFRGRYWLPLGPQQEADDLLSERTSATTRKAGLLLGHVSVVKHFLAPFFCSVLSCAFSHRLRLPLEMDRIWAFFAPQVRFLRSRQLYVIPAVWV